MSMITDSKRIDELEDAFVLFMVLHQDGDSDGGREAAQRRLEELVNRMRERVGGRS